jgi:hypothetical protein
MLGFFSFTEITNPMSHGAYNAWHQLDHLPEQFTLDGIRFGQRWVCTADCQKARLAVSPLLAPCHYMTLYLMRDAEVLAEFFALARTLREAGRFFEDRRAHLSGPFEVIDRWVSPHLTLSAGALPFRPCDGIYVVAGPPVDGAALVAHDGVTGAWAFADHPAPDHPTRRRHITVAFVKGDLLRTAATLGQWCLQAARSAAPPAAPLEWAGPLEGIDANHWNWFDRLTPQ